MPPSRPRLRVFLADDHPIVLDGIKALILADPRLELVGQASDGQSALRRAVELRPDVAVIDLSMPGLNGVELSRRLLAAHPLCRVVVLTVHEESAYLRELLDIGVAGYVLKRSATEELGRSIHAVAAGGIYLDPAIAGQAIHGKAAQAIHGNAERLAPAPDTEGLTLSAREVEVLRLTASGHSNKAIASRLEIGLKSVDTYKARAMAKLGFHSRVDVVRFALHRGWLAEAE